MKRSETPDAKTMRPIRQNELEARVQGVVDEIASVRTGDDSDGDSPWLDNSTFVRRMQEFVVYN